FHNSTTPLRMVLSSEENRLEVRMIGTMLAGRYRIMAAISRAHVRATESGLRRCRLAPQRGHAPQVPVARLRQTWPHTWQPISPSREAVAIGACGALTGSAPAAGPTGRAYPTKPPR